MALSTFVGSLAQPGATGNQAITGVGFQPKIVFFWIGQATADGSTATTALGFGAATSSTNRNTTSQSSSDAANPELSTNSLAEALALRLGVGGAAVCAADMVSMDSDGFTINWTVVDANARIVSYMALGGTDLTNAIVGTSNSNTTTGNQAITGLGFQPNSILLYSLRSGTQSLTDNVSNGNGNRNLGWATSSTSRGAAAFRTVNNVSPTVNRSWQKTNKCYTLPPNSGNTALFEADFVSMDSDGFTINWTTASATSLKIYWIALKGASVRVGSFNQATSTGNASVSGLSFQPKVVTFISANVVADNTNSSANDRGTVGAATSSSARFSRWFGDRDASVVSIADSDLDRTKVIKMMSEALLVAPTTQAAADFVSMDSAGFTVNWSTADATAREILYLAFGSTAQTNTNGLLMFFQSF